MSCWDWCREWKKIKFKAKKLIHEATFAPISRSSHQRKEVFKMLLVFRIQGKTRLLFPHIFGIQIQIKNGTGFLALTFRHFDKQNVKDIVTFPFFFCYLEFWWLEYMAMGLWAYVKVFAGGMMFFHWYGEKLFIF